MQIDPTAILAVISEQANRIAQLEHENARLGAIIDDLGPSRADGRESDA